MPLYGLHGIFEHVHGSVDAKCEVLPALGGRGGESHPHADLLSLSAVTASIVCLTGGRRRRRRPWAHTCTTDADGHGSGGTYSYLSSSPPPPEQARRYRSPSGKRHRRPSSLGGGGRLSARDNYYKELR